MMGNLGISHFNDGGKIDLTIFKAETRGLLLGMGKTPQMLKSMGKHQGFVHKDGGKPGKASLQAITGN